VPKHHSTPLSGGIRKALMKELSWSRAMTQIFAERSEEKRVEGEALILGGLKTCLPVKFEERPSLTTPDMFVSCQERKTALLARQSLAGTQLERVWAISRQLEKDVPDRDARIAEMSIGIEF
jgi:hypothetical protein